MDSSIGFGWRLWRNRSRLAMDRGRDRIESGDQDQPKRLRQKILAVTHRVEVERVTDGDDAIDASAVRLAREALERAAIEAEDRESLHSASELWNDLMQARHPLNGQEAPTGAKFDRGREVRSRRRHERVGDPCEVADASIHPRDERDHLVDRLTFDGLV